MSEGANVLHSRKSAWVQERQRNNRHDLYKTQEQNVDLYMTFVDLTKAFDTVSRDGLWKIMEQFGCPPRFITMVRQFRDGMQARVQNDGEYSEPFPMTNGVKQGFVMAPTPCHAHRRFS